MASLIVSRFGTCENFPGNSSPTKRVPRRPIGWWGDLFGRYESFMFFWKQIVNISSNRKKGQFSIYISYRHWTFTKKIGKMCTSATSFTYRRVIFPLLWTLKTPEEVWSPAYGITQGCYHLTATRLLALTDRFSRLRWRVKWRLPKQICCFYSRNHWFWMVNHIFFETLKVHPWSVKRCEEGRIEQKVYANTKAPIPISHLRCFPGLGKG